MYEGPVVALECNTVLHSTSPTFSASRNLQKVHNAVLLSRTTVMRYPADPSREGIFGQAAYQQPLDFRGSTHMDVN